MAKAETRPQEKETRKAEGVSPPPSADSLSPMERLADLTRRIIQVPKSEAIPPKRKAKRKR